MAVVLLCCRTANPLVSKGQKHRVLHATALLLLCKSNRALGVGPAGVPLMPTLL